MKEGLNRVLYKIKWTWHDVVDCMSNEFKDAFMSLTDDQREVLMKKYERSIQKGMEAGIMSDWDIVMETAIENSGLIEELKNSIY